MLLLMEVLFHLESLPSHFPQRIVQMDLVRRTNVFHEQQRSSREYLIPVAQVEVVEQEVVLSLHLLVVLT